MSFTQVFGGGLIYPTDASYSSTPLVGDITLRWPTEIGSNPLACAIMDVNPQTAGLNITLPSARLVSVGENILFYNIGSHAFNVLKNDGTQILSVPPSTAWQVYLTDNSTVGGMWNSFQFGAGVSVAVSGALAGAGLVSTGATLSQSVPVTTLSNNYTTGLPDQARALVWTGANGSITVPDASTLGSGWFTHVKNAGTGSVNIAPLGGSLIDGLPSLSVPPGGSFLLACDGTSFYTIGNGGTNASNAFTFLSIPVPGANAYTLSPIQYANSALKFTGALTGNRQVIVPNITGRYYIDNATSGPFSLTIKTAAGTGYSVTQGSRMIVYCDGTNVYDAVSLGSSGGVVPIASGGTSATTASGALVNLGGTAIGTAVFTAASPAVARAAIGATAVGDAVFTAATPAAARTVIGAISEDDAIVYALTFG